MKVALVFLLLIPIAVFGQASDFGNWLIYLGDKKINQKWNLHNEVQYRNFNLLGDTEQLLLRAGLGYNLSEGNNNLLTGLAYIYSEPYVGTTDAKTSTNEMRIYQQFITRQRFGRVAIQHRYRFEQRFLNEDLKLRLRYFLALNIALNKDLITDKAVYISIYNEVFMNTTQTIFDRNRLYAGLGYRFSPKLRTELGVMNQATNSSDRYQLNVFTFVNF